MALKVSDLHVGGCGLVGGSVKSGVWGTKLETGVGGGRSHRRRGGATSGCVRCVLADVKKEALVGICWVLFQCFKLICQFLIVVLVSGFFFLIL